MIRKLYSSEIKKKIDKCNIDRNVREIYESISEIDQLHVLGRELIMKYCRYLGSHGIMASIPVGNSDFLFPSL